MTMRILRLGPLRQIQYTRRLYATQRVIFMDEKELLLLDSEPTQSRMMDAPMADLLTSEHHVRGSPEAEFGKKRIGCVHLPKALSQSISDLIDKQQDKRLIRTDALRLYEAMRSTARLQSEQETSPSAKETRNTQKSTLKGRNKDTQNTTEILEPHNVSYGPRESMAYAAGVLPSTYAAVTNVLEEVNKRIKDFCPKTMLDFGTGPGTAIWAAQDVFDIDKYVGVDLSEDMLRVAETLQESVKKTETLPIEFKRYLAVDPNCKTDLVVSAFALGDIASLALQRSTMEQLWEQTGDVLVLIERGTPVGFSIVARARQWILDAEKRKDQQVHVVAPCPHDRPCPLLFSPQANLKKAWCHFSQRVERPSFLMKTKHSKFNTEDAKYSYVVLRKGPRPTSATDSEHTGFSEAAYAWPRLIQPPLKNKGHVVMDLCVEKGEIQRTSIPKSQGKIPYRDARKSMWGDLFPHPSKTKWVTRVSQGTVEEEQAPSQQKKKL